MKYIKIIAVIAILIIMVVGYNTIETNKYKNDNVQLPEKVINKDLVSVSKKKKEIINDISTLSEDEQSVVDIIKPINETLLLNNWESEYGCYKGNVNLAGDVNCKNSFLTASSFDEAIWMQRQGYPRNSSLELLNHPEEIKILESLAFKNKYIPAMSVLAVKYLENQDLEKAKLIGTYLTAYSKSSSFSHKIYGESLLANNDLYYGLYNIKIASILGDNEAQYVFNRYLPTNGNIALEAIDRAYIYMSHEFGLAEDYPTDPRPISGDGD